MEQLDNIVANGDAAVESANIAIDILDEKATDLKNTDLLAGLSSLDQKYRQGDDEEFDLPPPPPALLPSDNAEIPSTEVKSNECEIADLLGTDLTSTNEESDLPPPPPTIMPTLADSSKPLIPEVLDMNLGEEGDSSNNHPVDLFNGFMENGPTSDVIASVSDVVLDTAGVDLMCMEPETSPASGLDLKSEEAVDEQAAENTELMSPKTEDSGIEPETSPAETPGASTSTPELIDNKGEQQQDPVEEEVPISCIVQNDDQEDDFEFEVPTPLQAPDSLLGAGNATVEVMITPASPMSPKSSEFDPQSPQPSEQTVEEMVEEKIKQEREAEPEPQVAQAKKKKVPTATLR